MTGRVRVWAGSVVGVLALVGLAVYLGTVGLDKADKWASVIGVFVALAAFGVSLYGLLSGRRSDISGPASAQVTPSGQQSISVDGGNSGISSTGDGATNIQMRAEASGHGSVYQAGGDQNISS
ncbi:hypothetical protein NE235_11540 [Actinoallomurus spadix]|uniref:Uncharacterized protein n=1 Tax=Actinoallomurus spadix TaxID=79912 RepID=A0ABP3GLQ2_9ACTN|nr:hypothetical protein [Actinoallomurus spadix]MCO5986733.1 hypothetical protein [Actinoallomurus spadix]